MKILKKITLTTVALSSIACFAVAGGSVFAATISSTPPPTQFNQQDLSNLKAKGDAEINRRIAALNTAESKISASTKLSSSDQSYLKNEVSTEISGLISLETTLNNETQVSAARTDVQSIYNEYRVYALVLPKTWLVTAADGEQNTDTKLGALSTKLQARITADQNAGKNVTTLQSDLSDMNTQIANAQSIASSIESKVLTLQPSDYNTDHAILSGDATQLKTAHSDNQAAYTDAKNIVAGLKSLE